MEQSVEDVAFKQSTEECPETPMSGLEARDGVQEHETDQSQVLHVVHVLDNKRLEVPEPPDDLKTIPIDSPAAGNIEVL